MNFVLDRATVSQPLGSLRACVFRAQPLSSELNPHLPDSGHPWRKPTSRANLYAHEQSPELLFCVAIEYIELKCVSYIYM